jgi:hypothetical protein
MSALQRIAANVLPPRTDATLRSCATCLAVYLDYDLGRDAHEVVFGHQPATVAAQAQEAS